MAKYKYLGGDDFPSRIPGMIYEGNDRRESFCYSVEELARKNPAFWQPIKEEPMCAEKTIKLSLDQAKKMYGKSPEMDELLLANFSKEELTKKELPKSWNEARPTSGYKITYNSYGTIITKLPAFNHSKYDCKAIFATEKQARSCLAMAQLSQLMAVYNEDWEANFKSWSDKCVISCRAGSIIREVKEHDYQFLAFKSAEIRDEFLKNFEPLIKEYFMID